MGFISGLPAAAMDPEHYGFAGPGLARMVDVEDVSGMTVFDIRYVASNRLGR